MQPTSQRKTPIWVWILVAVVAVFLLGGLALGVGGFFLFKSFTEDPAAIAKVIASTNPDIEVLETDGKRGVLKVRDKKQNKIISIDLNEAKQGRITVVGDNGEAWI
jgi:hypothetical protein